ncbi:MAG: hypothetical protein SRB1_01716 [Desulfobacteraceae bacterium Eth-SRB1]|nr:MAG: hypothetical protein SRB1_01716 [Desulfobacteraceae bacterium Eth-SRB1]
MSNFYATLGYRIDDFTPSAREPDHGRRGKKTSGGTILGLSLNFEIWIRDD